MHIAAFDLTTTSRDELIALLKEWTQATEAMVQGHEIGEGGATGGNYDAPPQDTGEASDLSASHLTVTIGFGRSLFVDAAGEDRFGVAHQLPDELIEMPHFPGDMLDPERTGGDLVVQACADDPQVAVHAVRNLARIGFGRARVRWSQIGFGRTSSTSTTQKTPRNLFGFKDGTASIKAEQTDLMEQHVWAAHNVSQPWMAAGTFMVTRRIRMHIETWDRAPLREQEDIVGRTKREGAPMSGGTEFTEPDFALPGRDGPLINTASHIAVAHPTNNSGVHMLRRGFNYTDGSDGLGRLDAGLFFIAFVTDPRTHYVPMQNAMAKNDLMSEYLKHTGSGLFAIPPGFQPGGYLGETLFA